MGVHMLETGVLGHTFVFGDIGLYYYYFFIIRRKLKKPIFKIPGWKPMFSFRRNNA